MNPRETFTWLALDASLRAFGWALFVDDGEVHSCQLYKAGVWETERDPKLKPSKTKTGKKKRPPGVMKDNARRMNQIGEQLAEIVQTEHPVAIFIESLATPFMRPTAPGEKRAPATSLVTVQALGRIRGIVDGIALVLGVPVFEVSSQAIKVAMTGERDAEKAEVGRRVLQLYPAVRNFLPVGEIDDNVTDAVACGHIGESHEVIAENRRRRRREGQSDLFDKPAPDPFVGEQLVPGKLMPEGLEKGYAEQVMREQLDAQLAAKRKAEETTAQRIKRLATPAVVHAPSAIKGGAPVPIGNDPIRAAALRPPKATRGKLTAEPPRSAPPAPFKPPTPEQLADFWKEEP